MSCRLYIPDNDLFLSSASSFIKDIAIESGMNPKNGVNLQFALEDLVKLIFVYLHDSDPEEQDLAELTITVLETGIEVRIYTRRGFPVELGELPSVSPQQILDANYKPPSRLDDRDRSYDGFGIYWIRRMVDEFDLNYVSRGGYEFRIVKYFDPAVDRPSVKGTKKSEKRIPAAKNLENIPITIRRMEEKDAINVVRGVFETYGYDMFEYIPTEPKKLIEWNRSGKYFSYVYETSRDGIIGHVAVKTLPEDPKIGEICNAFMRPRFRGNVHAQEAAKLIYFQPHVKNLAACFTQALTIHYFTQMSARMEGMIAVYFAFDKFKMSLKKTHRSAPEVETLVGMFRFSVFNERRMYVSLKYQKIVKSLYKRLGIKTVLTAGSAENIRDEGKTVFRTEEESKASRTVYIDDIGTDIEKRLKDLLFSIKKKGISVLALFIPTDLAWSVLAMDSADRLGMIFSGIFPAGDYLVFHYFNGIALDFDAIRLIPDNGQDLLEIIQKEYEQKIF
ncbi:MAG: hypothetical protein Q4G69_04535 [Planctomycetia bacterium]|nr:hypothetical protein [Planctomycetia bacterium]